MVLIINITTIILKMVQKEEPGIKVNPIIIMY